MIIGAVRGDVFSTELKHIAFAVNTEGLNDAGFAGIVAQNYWPRLANTSPTRLGRTFSLTTIAYHFHALVCHSLGPDGWQQTPQAVTECLDSLYIPDNEPIAVVLMGTGFVGTLGNADVYAIIGGLARSKKRVVLYTL